MLISALVSTAPANPALRALASFFEGFFKIWNNRFEEYINDKNAESLPLLVRTHENVEFIAEDKPRNVRLIAAISGLQAIVYN